MVRDWTSGAGRAGRRGPASTRVVRLTIVAGLVGIIAGCADQDEQSLCSSYAEYVVLADEVYAADPTGATVSDVAETADVVFGELAQLRAVADGRYRAPIDELRSLLRDLENTLGSVDADAGYDTWEPLVDDTLDDIRIADARLRRVMNPACAAVFSGGEVSMQADNQVTRVDEEN